MLEKLNAVHEDLLIPLPAGPNFRAATHLWSQSEIHAIRLALAARRPLLVRGEPGCGKSQLARAAAYALEVGEPLVEVVHPRLEASDLLYRFDAMARLLDAQLADKSQWDPTNVRYVEKGVVWRAFELARQSQFQPVVLIDEIDKADADVPNSLLDVLGNRGFDVPMLKGLSRRVEADEHYAPLIVVTTNEDRELPAAFIRRCVVLNLNPPLDPDRLRRWMVSRVWAHAGVQLGFTPRTVGLIVDQTLADREASEKQGYPKVGLAEAIDLVNALMCLTQDVPEQKREVEHSRLLDELSAYALVKHPLGEPGQARVPLSQRTPAAS